MGKLKLNLLKLKLNLLKLKLNLQKLNRKQQPKVAENRVDVLPFQLSIRNLKLNLNLQKLRRKQQPKVAGKREDVQLQAKRRNRKQRKVFRRRKLLQRGPASEP